MSKPKYAMGMQITTLIDAVALIMAGAVFYFPGSRLIYNSGYKTIHASFLQNWSLRQIQVAVNRGTLYLAEKNEKGVAK